MTSKADHQHEWSALWDHFGPYGDQDAHRHVCAADDDCEAVFIGEGRDCNCVSAGVLKVAS